MKLFGDDLSGNCLKGKYVADYLDLPVEWVSVDINKGESRADWFLAMHPGGQVPVLMLDDGQVLGQSNAILQYLADGSDLLPEGAFERALVNEWLFFEQYSHEPYIAVCRSLMVYQGKSKEDREPWRVAKGEAALDYMEKRLTGKTFLALERFTIADIALIAYTRLAGEGGFDLSTRPSVQAWIARCESELGLS